MGNYSLIPLFHEKKKNLNPKLLNFNLSSGSGITLEKIRATIDSVRRTK